MITLAAIRTHRWGEDAARLHAQLAPVFGDRLLAVFHDRPADVRPPLPVIDISDRWLVAQGLRVLPDWGWRCGDYFLYALRQARPDAAHYWLIEPDVWFTGPVAAFFAEAEGFAQDFLGVRIERMRADHRFSKGLKEREPWRAIFALTRFSGRALDHLFSLRRAYSAGSVGPRFFSNDEVFCVSHLVADRGFATASLADLLPGWFRAAQMDTDPDILIDVLAGRSGPGVFHPVRGRASFRGAVAARLAGNSGFLGNMRASLAALDDDELRAIAAEAARRTEAALFEAAGRAAPALSPGTEVAQ